MTHKLGTNVKVGNKIMIGNCWHKIKEKKEESIITDNGVEVWYGNTINGWKNK